MNNSPQHHRDHFRDEGYTVFENVLSPTEVASAVATIDRLIKPDSLAPLVTSTNRNGRKQLDTRNCEPALANLAGHPRVLEAVKVLTGPHVRLLRTSIPCVTYKSPPGAENFESGYHVDWPNKTPQPGDDTQVFGVLHLSTVQPGGGAFMLIPRSHRLIERTLRDPALEALAERALKQDFKDFPGLGEPREMCAPAGSIVFYHAFLVHDRSENVREQPRKIVFTHYAPWGDGEYEERDPAKLAESFHPNHLASMDDHMRELCGLKGKL